MLSRGPRRLIAPLYRAHRAVTANVPSRYLSSEAAEDYTENKPVVDRFAGVGQGFEISVAKVLTQKVDESQVVIQRSGTIELPVDYYQKVLNSAFGHGGWTLVPVGEIIELDLEESSSQFKVVQLVREYALYCNGRFVSQCYGETAFFPGKQKYSDSTEKIKGVALTRCCKDLGIASELWDKDWVEAWKKKYAHQQMAKNISWDSNGAGRLMWKKKKDEWKFPFESCN